MTHPLRASVLRAAAGLVVVLGALTAPIAAGAQADPGVAPATSTSADGRTTTDGQRTLTTSQAAGLDPAGQTVAVAGSGYDPNKGIYVALCAIPPRNALPSPCGGGVDREGQAGAAQWISSNPPDYGVGLAQPYGPSGTFSTRFTVRAEIAPGIDCRQVRCALVTRSDHTRTSDRSQDIFIPVSFRADPVAPPTTAAPGPGGSSQAPGTTAPGGGQPTVDVPTTAAPEAPKTTAPEATVSGDGTEVTDGVRTLRVSDATDLDPEQVAITVAGTGFDAGAGIYVALCATAADPATAPGPCTAGGGASVWISSNPPEAGADLAKPFDAGGSFEVALDLGATIDGETDCREVACAITVRFDDQRRDDRTGDLALPVTFAKASTPETTTTTTTEPEAIEDDAEPEATVEVTDDASGGGRSAAPFAIGGGLAAAAAVGGGLLVRARRASAAGVPS